MKTTNTRPIRVLVADDHPAVRKGLEMILSTEPGIELIAEAADGQEAVAKTVELAPDVVLMDLVMPKMDGIRATCEISQCCPGTAVIIFTGSGSDEQNAMIASYAGAFGYISKGVNDDTLLKAIKEAYQHRSGVSFRSGWGAHSHGKCINQTTYPRT